MKKTYKYILFTILIIFTLNTNVKAVETEKDKTLGFSYCIYDINSDLSVRLKIDSDGGVTFSYYAAISAQDKKPSTILGSSNDSNDWTTATNGYTAKSSDLIADGIKTCPKYANLAQNTLEVIFKNTALSEDEQKVASGDYNIPIAEYHYEGDFGKTTNNDSSTNNTDRESLISEIDDFDNVTCEELIGEELASDIHSLVKIINILVPLVIIALSIVDFAIAVLSDEDKMKKAQSKFIKRLLLALGFFLIPTILQLLLTIANQIWPDIKPDLCGIL